MTALSIDDPVVLMLCRPERSACPERSRREGPAFALPTSRSFATLRTTDGPPVHRSPFTVHRSPFTVHRSPFTVHRSPFTVPRSPFTVHRSPFTVHRSPFTVHRSPFTSTPRSLSHRVRLELLGVVGLHPHDPDRPR